jgi:hypothetical protein
MMSKKKENIKVFFIVVFCIHLVTLFTGNSTAGAELDSVCSTALVYEFTDIETTEFTGHVVWTVTTPTSDFYGFMLIYRTNVGK